MSKGKESVKQSSQGYSPVGSVHDVPLALGEMELEAKSLLAELQEAATHGSEITALLGDVFMERLQAIIERTQSCQAALSGEKSSPSLAIVQ